jgi:hypothetical protein
VRPDYRPRCILCGGVIRDDSMMSDGVVSSDVLAVCHASCEIEWKAEQLRRERRAGGRETARGRVRALVD